VAEISVTEVSAYDTTSLVSFTHLVLLCIYG
jgi:hypothetical protein